MKNLFLLLFFTLIARIAFAQDSLLTEKNEYLIIYVIHRANDRCSIDIDNGKRIERLKDENAQTKNFPTTAAALNYVAARGWELLQPASIGFKEFEKDRFIFRHKAGR